MSYLSAFSWCSWGSQGKNTEVVCHSLLQWTTFCQTSPPWPDHLGWPHMAWLSFIELDTTVVLWSDWLVSVIMVLVCLPSDALLQHLLSYLGFSYLGSGVSLHGCSRKAQPLLLTLHEGYLLTIVVIWIKFISSSPVVHWFIKCQCSLLPSPVLPLPLYLDSWTEPEKDMATHSLSCLENHMDGEAW